MSSVAVQYTADFYRWETLGRGWLVSGLPIDLEPPFHPFFRVPLSSTRDDTRRPTLISNLMDALRGKSSQKVMTLEEADEKYIPFLFDNTDEVRILSVRIPKGCKIPLRESEQLLLMLTTIGTPISFEIIAQASQINFQFACRSQNIEHLSHQIQAYVPFASVIETTDLLTQRVEEGGIGSMLDYALKDEFMRPLTVSLDPDPYTGLLGAMEAVQGNELVVFQVLFQGTVNSWSESILRSVSDGNGESFFLDAPEMIPLAKEKVSAPLLAVTVRSFAMAESYKRAQHLLTCVGNALGRLYSSPSNALIPLVFETYDFNTRLDDLLKRHSHRLGMLLNSKELLSLVHFPSTAIASPKLFPTTRKTKPAPSIASGHDFFLGINEHNGKEELVSVSASQRLKHTHIIGATGTGKSTLLLNFIKEDMEIGNGLAVLDPHGDLIDNVLTHVPLVRSHDILLIDPSEAEFPVGLNILKAHSEIEKEILASDLVASFKRLSTSWGDQMNSVFANAILAFLESESGGTLTDLRRFLVEKKYREHFLKTVQDPSVIYYWQKEFPLLRTNSIGPILTRLDTFLRPRLIRNMIGQKMGLDFGTLLNDQTIILVKLSQGLIGIENSYLLGTLIVSKIHQAAMARQAVGAEERPNFFLYIDEFQNFVTPSMSAILTGARKYHLGLTLAHQDMQQMVKGDTELASAVMTNAGIRICFRLGDVDAKRFADGFSSFDASYLQNLNTGEAVVRIDRPDYDFSLTVEPVSDPELSLEEKEEMVLRARKTFGTPRDIVDLMLLQVKEEVETVQENVKETLVVEEIKKPLTTERPEKKPREITIEETNDTFDQLKKQKEQSQHRYLQTWIKKMAEQRGFVATIEFPLPEAKARVDVSLERNKKKIACEICVSTEIDWEMHNIQKCIDADYDQVIACSTEKTTIEALKNKIASVFAEPIASKILVFEPEEFFEYLDKQLAKEAKSEKRMKGYRVKVEYDPISESQMLRKKEMATKLILDAKKKK